MVAGLRTTTASLVLVGSVLLAEHGDVVTATAPRESMKNAARRRSTNDNHHRQLRSRKLAKGVAADEPAAKSKSQKQPKDDGDLENRAGNGDGAADWNGEFQSPVLVGCFRDFKLCESTGTLVSRNPALGCEFDPCTEEVACAADIKECDDGSFVSRDSANGCAFFPCEALACAMDVSECPDGTFVSRDPWNNCSFKPCPPDNRDDEKNGSNGDVNGAPSDSPEIEGNMPVSPGESSNGYSEGDFLLRNGAWVGCDWVGKKKTEERCQSVTANNELVSDLCPEICAEAGTEENNLPGTMEPISQQGNFTLASGSVVTPISVVDNSSYDGL